MICTCGHPPWHHQRITYPLRREPCIRCLRCGGDTRTMCCLHTKRCSCASFRGESL